MRQKIRPGTIVYLCIAAAIFFGFVYLGVAQGFSSGLDIGFVAILWAFVVLAMKTGVVRAPPGTPLPLTNVNARFSAPNLIRAFGFATFAMIWTGASTWFVHSHELDDTWYGVALVAIPMVALLGLFVTFLLKGFEIRFHRR